MHDMSDRYQMHTVPMAGNAQPRPDQISKAEMLRRKRLGDYLIEAGLLTKSQVDVALNDQQMTEMKFGEILAARGWVKQQTVEFLMARVVLPERRAIARHEKTQVAADPSPSATRQPVQGQPAQSVSRNTKPHPLSQPAQGQANQGQSFGRREAPISKPLPPVKSNDEDGGVNWVG